MDSWNKKFITPQEFHDSIIKLANMISKDKYIGIYAIPRGGLIVGVYLSHYLQLQIFETYDFLHTNPEKVLIVDDIADTGSTLKPFADMNCDSATVHYKPRSIIKPTYFVEECSNTDWIVYPFEKPEEIPNRSVNMGVKND